MNHSIDTQLKRIQRLRLLQKINSHDPDPVSDQGLFNVLMREDTDLGFTKRIIRQHLSYLHELGFVRVEKDEAAWAATIRPFGVDYLDGLREDQEGIARSTEA